LPDGDEVPGDGSAPQGGGNDSTGTGSGGGGTGSSTQLPDGFEVPVPVLTPDLLSQNISISTTTIGIQVTFSGTVKNSGNGSAASSRAFFELDTGNNGSWDKSLGTAPVSPLTPDGEHLVTSATWMAKKGIHRVKLCVDSDGEIEESDELNNCLAYQFFIP
jgi:subtilase family serine protease